MDQIEPEPPVSKWDSQGNPKPQEQIEAEEKARTERQNQKNQENYKNALEKASKDPRTAWMKDIAKRQDAMPQPVLDAYQSWDYDKQQLSGASALLITIAVSIATGGSGGGVVGAMLSAGMNVLTSQAIISFVNNKGNLKATLKELGSDETIKSITISMLTAGAMSGLEQTGVFSTFADKAEGGNKFIDTLGVNLRKNMVRGVLSVATGEPQNIGEFLKTAATSTIVDTAGSHFAGKIGESREEDGYWLHKAKHALLGAGTGALSDLSNPLRGAASGAIGAVIGECTAEGCVDSFTRDSQDLEELQAGIQKAANWGKMAAVSAAVLMGLDGGIAQRAGNNAVENNFIPHFIPVGIALLEIIDSSETAIEIYDIYEREGIEAAAERLGIEIAVNAAGAGAFRVGKSIFKSGSKVVDHVLKMNPRIKAQLGANADKLRGKLDELVGSGGKAGVSKSTSIFKSKAEYQAPSNGTGKKYTVYQQDIDSDLYIPREGKTNKELMSRGRAPYIEKDGKFSRVELHHSRQHADGPLFEVSGKTHNAKSGAGSEALHPYKTKRGKNLNGEGSGPKKSQHPTNPVDRKKFDIDRDKYWKSRIKKEE
jgi:hypothetical protein